MSDNEEEDKELEKLSDFIFAKNSLLLNNENIQQQQLMPNLNSQQSGGYNNEMVAAAAYPSFHRDTSLGGMSMDELSMSLMRGASLTLGLNIEPTKLGRDISNAFSDMSISLSRNVIQSNAYNQHSGNLSHLTSFSRGCSMTNPLSWGQILSQDPFGMRDPTIPEGPNLTNSLSGDSIPDNRHHNQHTFHKQQQQQQHL